MEGNEGIPPLTPVETLRAMVALRDNNSNGIAKRFYAMSRPGMNNGRVIRYFLAKEAASINILHHELNIPKSSLYGIVDELKGCGVLYEGVQIDIGLRGTNPILYVLAGAVPSRVVEAHKFHLELRGTVSGVFMENQTRLLVAPIVDDVIEQVMKMRVESDWQVPMWEVRSRFREEHGRLPPGFDGIVHGLAKEKGWNTIVKG